MGDSGKGRKKRFTLRGWRVALLAVLLLAELISLYVVAARSVVNRRLAALRADGYPTTLAELAKYTRLPPDKANAADVYTRAFEAYVPPVDEGNVPLMGEAEWPERGAPLPGPMTTAIAQSLAANEKCLALLHEAGAVEDCRYEWDYRDTLRPWEPLPHWAGARSCVFLLWVSAVDHAFRGETDAVVMDVRDGLRLTNSMRREPGAYSHQMRIGMLACVLVGLERTMSATSFTEQQLADLDILLAASESALDLEKTMITERCIAIEEIRARRFGRWPIPYLPGIRGSGIPDTLDYTEKCIKAAGLPVTERRQRFGELLKELDGLSFVHAAIKTCAPKYTRNLITYDTRVHAHISLARTALAVERYQLARGELPRQLEQLVPTYIRQVPIDPFDGKPVRYKRMDPGYRLYSVLDDGKDDGGRGRDEVKPGEPYDWPFIVTR